MMSEISVYCIMKFVYSMVACIAQYASENFLVTFFLSIAIALLVIGNVHLSKLLCLTKSEYDYGSERGPHSWPTSGPNQSPININTAIVEPWNTRQHLMWNHHNDLPIKVTMENDGRTVTIKASYAANVPTLSGADLLDSYTFESLCFHWSVWNTEGSEHTIDFRSYPMEIQATYKTGLLLSCIPTCKSLVLGYLFEISEHNHYLDPIVHNLHRVREAGTVIQIDPFPLAWLCYPFTSGFYSYGGSTTTPPCEEGVEWFISSHIMAISEWQLMEFRSLLSSDGSSRIIRNSRPVQYLTANRTVHFNTYDTGNINNSGTSVALNLSDIYNNHDD